MSTRNPENRFEVRLGRIRSASSHKRVTGFLKKVGRSGGKHGSKGRSAQRRISTTVFQRRVMVKVSIVRMEGRGAGAQRQHLNISSATVQRPARNAVRYMTVMDAMSMSKGSRMAAKMTVTNFGLSYRRKTPLGCPIYRSLPEGL